MRCEYIGKWHNMICCRFHLLQRFLYKELLNYMAYDIIDGKSGKFPVFPPINILGDNKMGKKYEANYITVELVCPSEYNVIVNSLAYDKTCEEICFKRNVRDSIEKDNEVYKEVFYKLFGECLYSIRDDEEKRYPICVSSDMLQKINIWYEILKNNSIHALNTKKTGERGRKFKTKTKDVWSYILRQGLLASKFGISVMQFNGSEVLEYFQIPIIMIVIVNDFILEKIPLEDIEGNSVFFDVWPLLDKAVNAYEKREEYIGYTEEEIKYIRKVLRNELYNEPLNEHFSNSLLMAWGPISSEYDDKERLDEAYNILRNYFDENFSKIIGRKEFIKTGLEFYAIIREEYKNESDMDWEERAAIACQVALRYAKYYREQCKDKCKNICEKISNISNVEKEKWNNKRQGDRNFAGKGHQQFRYMHYLDDIMYIICKYCDFLPLNPDINNNLWRKGASMSDNNTDIENRYELLKRYILYDKDMEDKMNNVNQKTIKNYYLFCFSSIAEFFDKNRKTIPWEKKDCCRNVYLFEKLFGFHLFDMETNIIIEELKKSEELEKCKQGFELEEKGFRNLLGELFINCNRSIFGSIYDSNGVFQRELIAECALKEFVSGYYKKVDDGTLSLSLDMTNAVVEKIKKTNKLYLEYEYLMFKKVYKLGEIGLSAQKGNKKKLLENIQKFGKSKEESENFDRISEIVKSYRSFYEGIVDIIYKDYQELRLPNKSYLQKCIDKYLKRKDELYCIVFKKVVMSSLYAGFPSELAVDILLM